MVLGTGFAYELRAAQCCHACGLQATCWEASGGCHKPPGACQTRIKSSKEQLLCAEIGLTNAILHVS